MGVEWHYMSGGQQRGPVQAAQLKVMATSGQLQPTDMVWKEGLPQWIPASSVKGLFDGVGVAAAAAPVRQPMPQQPARHQAVQQQLPQTVRQPVAQYRQPMEEPLVDVLPQGEFVFTGTPGGYFGTAI